jgi:hypothetical protein
MVTEQDQRRLARLLAVAHLGQAAILLAQPRALLRAITGDHGVPPSWVVRVLGARGLLQGALETVRPRPTILRLGIAVDLTHAASMLAAARIWPRYRRAALVSAGSAAVSALAGTVIVRRW